MSGWNRLSIRGKLFSIILLILVVNITVLLFAGSSLFEGFYGSSRVAALRESANRIRVAYDGSSETFYEEISRIENENTIVTLIQLAEDGTMRTTYRSRIAWKERPEKRPNMPQPPENEEDSRFHNLMLERISRVDEGDTLEWLGKNRDNRSDNMLELTTRLDAGLYLFMQTPRGYIKTSADMAVKYTALLSIGILLLGATTIYFVVGRVTKPIQRMQLVADKIAGMDFTERCRVTGGDEIGKLGTSINNMSGALQASIEKLVGANEVLQNDLVRQQRTDRMRREFVANVSHDFKTPLTLMISYAEALMSETEKDRLLDYSETILVEGNKLSGMVGRLLDLSKLESGVDMLEKSIFCLDELLDGVFSSLRVLMEKKELTLGRQVDSSLIVCADYGKIEQAVMNLADNAIKYATPGGVILVQARQQGKACRVSVENTGARIVEEDLENLFDSFYRADKSRKGDGQSYGLGLAIVRAVMQAHDVPYGVENLEDGVRFWFALDCWEEDFSAAVEQ